MKIADTGILFLIVAGISMAITAQEPKRELKKGETVNAFISENESHRYRLHMKKDQYALLEIMQKGVDLIVTTYDPEGQVLKIFDSPNGSDGPEYVTLLSSKAGNYELEIEPFDPESVDLSEFAGRYYIEELLTMYEFILEDGTLVARHQRHPDIKLTANGTERLSGDAWFFSQVEMVRDPSGSITGCKVSSDRVRNLVFTRM